MPPGGNGLYINKVEVHGPAYFYPDNPGGTKPKQSHKQGRTPDYDQPPYENREVSGYLQDVNQHKLSRLSDSAPVHSEHNSVLYGMYTRAQTQFFSHPFSSTTKAMLDSYDTAITSYLSTHHLDKCDYLHQLDQCQVALNQPQRSTKARSRRYVVTWGTSLGLQHKQMALGRFKPTRWARVK
jgi:hypothetical protein